MPQNSRGHVRQAISVEVWYYEFSGQRITAFQLLTVATHLATILAPDYLPKIYSAIATFWAVPLLLSMVAGVYLDHRAFKRLVPPQ